MYAELATIIETQILSNHIATDRKAVLQPFIDYILNKSNDKRFLNINFICTHNSRRSHLVQIWAQVAAHYYSIPNIFCYSGGTETTAVYPKVLETLQIQGFKINKLADSTNSIYTIKFDENTLPIIAFSKHFNNQFNPSSDFVAVMTCSDADTNCPFIPGADPKLADDSVLQNQVYKKRSIEIATEMFYIFSKISCSSV